MISPLAHVDPNAKIGEGVTIHTFAYIDEDVVIGDGCTIMPYASIIRGTRMGKNNKVYQGAVIGADPQDFRWKGQKTFCYIGDNNTIREQVIINRGIAEEGGTRIGDGCFIMAETHIGHDSNITGPGVLGNGVKVAGNVTIDTCTILSSSAIVHENSNIGKWVFVKGGCRVSGNVPPYIILAHNPAVYYGVNAKVMSARGDFSAEDIDNAAKAYRHIYQTQTSVFNALRRIENDIEPCTIREEILNFVRGHNYRIVAVPVDLEGD